jgi:hypothetical protein
MIAHQSLTCVGYRLPIGFPHSAHLCRRRERTAFTSAADAQIPRNRHNDTSIRSSGSPLATHPYEDSNSKVLSTQAHVSPSMVVLRTCNASRASAAAYSGMHPA